MILVTQHFLSRNLNRQLLSPPQAAFSVTVNTSSTTAVSPLQVVLVQTINYNFIMPQRLVVILGNHGTVTELRKESEASGCYSS